VVDLSITTRYWGWFWQACVDILPEWIAPNLITAVGFFQLILAFLVILVYSPNLSEELPGWLILANGLSAFLRQTLDAMDGKQARRTGQSSALGEFVDHAFCDAIEILFVSFNAAAVVRLGPGPLFYYFVFFGMASHFVEMWAIYITGRIEFWYFSFTESELVCVFTHIVIYLLGHNNIMGVIPGTELRYLEAIWYLVNLQFILALAGPFLRIPKYLEKKPEINRWEIYSFLLPAIWVFVASSAWIYQSPALLKEHVRPFTVMIGCCLANGGCRLVTARVCKIKPDRYYNSAIPLLFGVLNAGGRFVDEGFFVQLYCVYAIIAYAHYGISVIMTLSEVLKVNIITITPGKKPPPKVVKDGEKKHKKL
jgi:phosphatidylglycerophosphate synthase